MTEKEAVRFYTLDEVAKGIPREMLSCSRDDDPVM